MSPRSPRNSRFRAIWPWFIPLIASLYAIVVLWGVTMDPVDMNINRGTIGMVNMAELPLQTVVRSRKIQRSKETCFIDESTRQQRCAQPALGVSVGGGTSLPLLVGVGPALTGGGPLFEAILGEHSAILLGDSTQRGERCCGSELYFFSRRFPADAEGHPAQALAGYFPSENVKPDVRWLAEATPEYSDHFLAPYRLRATLQPGATALVFTLRDPLDAHAALYIHRTDRKGEEVTAQGFLEWSGALLNGDLAFQKCAAETVAKAAGSDVKGSGSKASQPMLRLGVTPDWVGDQAADEAIFESCRASAFHPSDRLEGVGSLAYSRTLPRWRDVLDEGVRAVCVLYSDLVVDAAHEGRRVAEVLGLDPDLIPDIDLSAALEPEGAALEQILEAAEGNAATAAAVRWHIARLRYQFAGEMEFAREFCANI